MARFAKGDVVMLAPQNNGTKAFQVFAPGQHVTVENVGSSCSACPNGRAGRSVSVKIAGTGTYFCEEAFVIASQSQPAKSGSGVSSRREDPARGLYTESNTDWDLLEDATSEEIKKLPTYDQLREMDRKREEERNAQSKRQ